MEEPHKVVTWSRNYTIHTIHTFGDNSRNTYQSYQSLYELSEKDKRKLQDELNAKDEYIRNLEEVIELMKGDLRNIKKMILDSQDVTIVEDIKSNNN